MFTYFLPRSAHDTAESPVEKPESAGHGVADVNKAQHEQRYPQDGIDDGGYL